MPLGGDAGRGPQREQLPPLAGLELGLLAQLAACGLQGVLAVGVTQARRQLEVGAARGVPVLPHARDPLVVVDRQHDDGARVLEDPRGRTVRRPGRPDGGCCPRAGPRSSRRGRGPGRPRPARPPRCRPARRHACRVPGVQVVRVTRWGDLMRDATVRRELTPRNRSLPAALLRVTLPWGPREMTDTAAGPLSLTRAEAEERFALLDVERYDIAVDLRGLLEGEVLEATSTVTFRCHRPGSRHVRRLHRRDHPRHAQRRRPRPGHRRAADACRCPACRPTTCSSSARGRATPPAATASSARSTRATSSSTSGRPSSRTWPGWPSRTSTSPTSRPCTPSPSAHRRPGRCSATRRTPPSTTSPTAAGSGASPTRRGSRRTSRSSTPGRSTRSGERRGDHDLGLYCRQSLKHLLDRDADELFELTEQGLAWFGEKFGAPFPQEKYDQVFVPDMGGAMENWGCVTYGDGAAVPQHAHPRAAADGSPRSCCTRWRTCGSATW